MTVRRTVDPPVYSDRPVGLTYRYLVYPDARPTGDGGNNCSYSVEFYRGSLAGEVRVYRQDHPEPVSPALPHPDEPDELVFRRLVALPALLRRGLREWERTLDLVLAVARPVTHHLDLSPSHHPRPAAAPATAVHPDADRDRD